MPLAYIEGKNPFRHSYFNILRIGPKAENKELAERAKSLRKAVEAGIKYENDPGSNFDEHQINEAANKLRDPSVRIEEMLLVHRLPIKDQRRLKNQINKLEALANLPAELPDLTLTNHLAVLWFLPPPGTGAAQPPDWQEFGLGQAGRRGRPAIGYCI